MIYAYHNGRFWRWDEGRSIWKESHLMAQKFERARAALKTLTPESFFSDGAEFALLDEYEISLDMTAALRDAKPCKSAPVDPVEEESFSDVPAPCICSTCTCGGCKEECFGNCRSCGHPVQECNSYQTDGEKHLTPAHNEDVAAQCGNTPLAPTFDFSALGDFSEQAAAADQQFDLHYGAAQDEYLISCIYLARIHALTAKAGRYGGGTWTKWYESKGLGEGSVRRMIQNGEAFNSANLAELKQLTELTRKDLNLIARSGCAGQLVEAAGDSQRVQELLAQLKAEKERADTAEKSAQNGVNHDFLFESNIFRQLSACKEGGIWVRNWTNAAESSNIRFLRCDFYKAGGDEVLAVWGWGGIVKDVLISGCNFYEVDDEKYRARGFYPAWGITLGQTGKRCDVRMENCVVRMNRCETLFRMLGDGTHAVVDNCDIYSEQPEDMEEHDWHKGAYPILARGNNKADGSTLFSNCRIHLRGDNGRRICYQMSALRNNYFDVECGYGPSSTREVIGNVFQGSLKGVIWDCNVFKDNVVELTNSGVAWMSGASEVIGNQFTMNITTDGQGAAVFHNNWHSGRILNNKLDLTYAKECDMRQYEMSGGPQYVQNNIINIKGARYTHLQSAINGLIYRKNNFFNNVPEKLFECTGVAFDEETHTEQYKKHTSLGVTISPEACTDPVVYTWENSDGALDVGEYGAYRPLKDGTANITVTCGKKTVTCAVTAVEASELPTYTEGEWALDNTVAYVPMPNLEAEHTLYAAFDVDTSCVDASKEFPLISSLLSGQTGQEAIKLAFGADGDSYKTVRWYTTDATSDEKGNTTLYRVTYVNDGFKEDEPASTHFLYLKSGVANGSGAVIWASQTSTVKAAPNSGILSFNVQTSADDTPITSFTSGAALAAALASGSVHATKATGFKLKELILFTNASYTTLDEMKKYHENAEIDLRFDADGHPLNAGTAGDFVIAGEGGEIVPVSSVTLNKTALSLAESGTDTLTASVLPAEATEKTVTWSVSPEGVVTLSGTTGSSITVTAAAAGECTITAAAGGKTATCAVSVVEASSGDSDPVPVFSLPETAFVPSEQKVVDTGIKLFESADGAKDYTIIISQRPNSTDTSTPHCLLHCMEETSPNPGLSLSHGKSAYAISAFGRRADQLLSESIGFNTNTVVFAIRVSAKRVWAKAYACNNGVFIESKGWVELYSDYAAVDKTLLIGGYQTSDGVKGHFWDGTVNWCKIYDKLLTEEQINKIMAG